MGNDSSLISSWIFDRGASGIRMYGLVCIDEEMGGANDGGQPIGQGAECCYYGFNAADLSSGWWPFFNLNVQRVRVHIQMTKGHTPFGRVSDPHAHQTWATHPPVHMCVFVVCGGGGGGKLLWHHLELAFTVQLLLLDAIGTAARQWRDGNFCPDPLAS